MENYTILHLHTDLSTATTNIDSVTKSEDYIKRASELGMKAIAFTEHGNILNWAKKKETCEKYGLKYIHGIEAYLTKTLNEKVRDNYHCCLYAKNYDGVKELNKLISKSFNRKDNHFYYTPRITLDELEQTSDNIIITSACLGGIFGKADKYIQDRYLKFFIKNKNRCYLEIQHHLDEKQVKLNQKLFKLAKENDLNLTVGTDTHALNEVHAKGRKILQQAKKINFSDEDKWDITFKTYDELIDMYQRQNAIPMNEVLKALENTNKIANSIETFDINREYKYPKLWDNPEELLKEKINKGIKEKGLNKLDNFKTEYLPRIKEELKTYKHNKAIDFLLLDEDIKSYARQNNRLPGYSRGSVSGSLVAYIIGLTDMDSIKHKLNFQRFMNVERVSLADIDTDWDKDDRKFIKEYIYNKEGLYCADIITFNTVALKGSIRDVGRALEIPLSEINEICDNIENKEEEYRALYPQLFEYVDIINGTIVSVGTHPCFLGNELVLTKDGYKEIKDITTSDFVLTHKNRFKQVANIMINESNNIYEVSPSSSLPIKVTNNHPFYVRKKMDKRKKIYSNPKWINVENIQHGDMIGIPVNNNSNIIENKYNLPYTDNNLWWLIGRYLGDGWITEMNRVDKRNKRKYIEKYLVICCNKNNDETKDIVNVLDEINFKYTIQERRTCNRIYIRNVDLLNYLKRFGKYAYGKFIPNEVIDMPINLLESLIDGYLSADGHYDKKHDVYSFKTVSKKLALSMMMCIAKVYKRHCGTVILKSRKNIIEGREVNSREKYNVLFTKDIRKGEKSFYENGYIWTPAKSIKKIDLKEKTYNLSVYDDNSYTVNNVAVHNCGLVCSPEPLDENMGLMSLSTCDYPVTMLNMKEIDSQNYVKLDLLALDNITLINKTCELLGIKRLNPNNVPDDEKVWKSIRDNTLGIFQWEGTGENYIKDLFSDETIANVKKYNPNFKYIDLFSVGNGAIRPAGASYREQLSKGIFKDNGHKALNEFLSPTLGYLVYQEQIIEFLNKFCGFSMGEADIVRRGFAKKTGTEQYIPKIKEGFTKTMKDEYGLSEEESNKIIVDFLKVIYDASSYLFSLNHSQAYSYIGYICGYLRYYYPLEFLTTMFNIYEGDIDKTKKIVDYAEKLNIKLKNPKFRYSKGEYFMDKETNSIYKGLSSIKFISKNAGEILYNLKDNQYDSFIDLLIDIGNKINSKNINILIRLDFFSEFGTIPKLLKVYELYQTFYSKKQISKEKYPNLNKIFTKFAIKESDKMFKFNNTLPMLRYMESKVKNKENNTAQLIQDYFEFTGSCDIRDKSFGNKYLVVDINTKYAPKITLYSLSKGKSTTIKIYKKHFKLNPLKLGDIIGIKDAQWKYKKKEVDGKWIQTEEKELIVESYKIY